MNKSTECRIYIVKSTNIVFIQKEKAKRKKSNQTITLLAGGRGWARALLESLLAAQAVAFILCGSHPPRTLFYTKRKKSNQTITLLAGGRGWIRTTEVIDDRFTVCSLWPLGNSSTIGAGERTRTPDLLITNQLLYQLSYTSVSPTP